MYNGSRQLSSSRLCRGTVDDRRPPRRDRSAESATIGVGADHQVYRDNIRAEDSVLEHNRRRKVNRFENAVIRTGGLQSFFYERPSSRYDLTMKSKINPNCFITLFNCNFTKRENRSAMIRVCYLIGSLELFSFKNLWIFFIKLC